MAEVSFCSGKSLFELVFGQHMAVRFWTGNGIRRLLVWVLVQTGIDLPTDSNCLVSGRSNPSQKMNRSLISFALWGGGGGIYLEFAFLFSGWSGLVICTENPILPTLRGLEHLNHLLLFSGCLLNKGGWSGFHSDLIADCLRDYRKWNKWKVID